MSGFPPAEISVIIVNYGTAELALAAVESVLARNHGSRTVDVHLVDNASPGGDAATIAEAHAARDWGGRVTLYLEAENHGFGRGNNLVLKALAEREVPPTYVMLLNPDARLENEAVAILAGFLDDHPAAAAAGAGIALPDGTPVTAAFRFPSPAWEFAGAVNFGPVTRLFDRWRVPLPPDHPPGPVDWVSGAAVMLRLADLLTAGGFDPDFFLYFEEVELMHRLHRAGGEVWFRPEARVVHAESVSTGMRSRERQRRPEYWYRSWRHFHSKARGRAGVLLAAGGWMLGAGLNGVICLVRRREPSFPKFFARDFVRHVLRPLLTAEKGRS